ncbi:MAG: DinB family protein [Anaerolineae bacterium]
MDSEVHHYLHMIEDLRDQVSDLIANLPAEALNWRPVEGIEDHATNSLAVLATHIAGAEHFWIAEVIGGQPPTRDRHAEFATKATGPAELRRRLEETGVETREALSSLRKVDLDGTREVNGRTVPVRWAILHVIDHTALHLGHMEITYQLWRKGQSKPSPRWFQRLPSSD